MSLFCFVWRDGGGLSQLCWEHCITENYSAILFSICCAFCCGLVFFKPLQYFGAPENILTDFNNATLG